MARNVQTEADKAAWRAAKEAEKAAKAARRRSVVYPLRLSADERAALTSRARASGLTPSQLLRSAALGNPIAEDGAALPRRIEIDPAAIAELRRVGVNLNQLTRAFHSTGDIPPGVLPQEIAALNTARENIEALFMRLIEGAD